MLKQRVRSIYLSSLLMINGRKLWKLTLLPWTYLFLDLISLLLLYCEERFLKEVA